MEKWNTRIMEKRLFNEIFACIIPLFHHSKLKLLLKKLQSKPKAQYFHAYEEVIVDSYFESSQELELAYSESALDK